MNKAQLAALVAEKLGIAKKDATEAVDAVLNSIIESVVVGNKVSLAGFGIFEGVIRAAREARNPRTGETVEVPETTVPKFKPAQAFKEALKG